MTSDNEEIIAFTFEQAYNHVLENYWTNYFGYGLRLFSIDKVKTGFTQFVEKERFDRNDMSLIAYNDLLIPTICQRIVDNKMK